MTSTSWPSLVEALDSGGLTAEPSTVWQVRAIADGPDAPPREMIEARA